MDIQSDRCPVFSQPSPIQAQQFDLFAVPDDYCEDPAPYFRLLRDHDPRHANADGSVLLTRYQDVRQAWCDLSGVVDKSTMYRAKFGEGPLLEHHTTTMLFRDPPDHDRLRAIASPFFTQACIASLHPFVEEKVAQLLDEAAQKADIDFVADFASRLPISVICRGLGVPQTDAALLQRLGRQILFPLNPKVSSAAITAGHEATTAFKAYLLDFVQAARRRHALDPRAAPHLHAEAKDARKVQFRTVCLTGEPTNKLESRLIGEARPWIGAIVRQQADEPINCTSNVH